MWHAWERREMCTGFWWERPKERDHGWEDGTLLDLRKIGWGRVDSTGSEYGPMAGCCECEDEPSCSGAM
jgi:hypothetical protein